MQVLVAVDVQILIPPMRPIEHYRLWRWEELCCWKANAAAYPTRIVEQYYEEMNENQKWVFDFYCGLAQWKKSQEYKSLRKMAGA